MKKIILRHIVSKLKKTITIQLGVFVTCTTMFYINFSKPGACQVIAPAYCDFPLKLSLFEGSIYATGLGLILSIFSFSTAFITHAKNINRTKLKEYGKFPPMFSAYQDRFLSPKGVLSKYMSISMMAWGYVNGIIMFSLIAIFVYK
ncbi:hypothetical protein ACDA63_08470 [Uliginosibacterium sp. sgz301328]|uniref:hypothetical protein n=1 Tax=Uliginosibacterium sp. sgz301328 TaxID=3243764 RepID=UPI00359D43D0